MGLGMPPPCNKCKRSVAQEGDTWCLGCASLEHAQNVLRQPWRSQPLRLVAEEALLSGARLVRAFSNLDQQIQVGVAGSNRAPETSAKSRASRPPSRSPRRDTRPPLRRSPARAAAAEPSVDRESDSDIFEEEEEEEEEPPTEVKKEDSGGGRPPEPEGPPPGQRSDRPAERRSEHKRHHHSENRTHHQKSTSGKKKRRGGTKHQRRYSDLDNPFRRSHRKIRPDLLELAATLEEGLARRH